MTSGADTNIIGSQVSGKKVNMEVGGNLNIESLQEKDDYREKNSSSGFNISASMSGGINTNDPDIAASYSKGKIHSNWKSITGQAGIYAGADGFDIHVKKNTDLKGSVIASEAASDKNTLSTETLTYGNIENSASYSASSKGLSYRKFANGAYGAGEGYNMKGLTPVLSVPARGDTDSTTKSAIAPGSIDVREHLNQERSALGRDTAKLIKIRRCSKWCQVYSRSYGRKSRSILHTIIWRHRMFICKSFLLDLRCTILDLDNIDPTIFTEVTDIEGIRKIAQYVDKEYLEGAILLSYYDDPILSFSDWDPMVSLWIYFAMAVEEILNTGEAHFCMPDHPGDLSFKEHPRGFIKLHTDWNDKRYWLPEKEFLGVLLQGAIIFFKTTDEGLCLNRKYIKYINYCEELLEKVQERFQWGYHSYLSLPNE